MAKLDAPFNFTGRIQKLSYFRRQGSDQIIIRYGSGPSKRRIQTDPHFESTRQNNREFKVINMLTKDIYKGLKLLKPVFDHNVFNTLMNRSRTLQKLDPNDKGKRNALFSKHGQLFEHINFNKKFAFDSILTASLEYEIDASTLSACIRIPELIPGVGFQNLPNLPYYKFCVTLQSVLDVPCEEEYLEHQQLGRGGLRILAYSDWHRSIDPFPGIELSIQLQEKAREGTLMLCMGIFFSKGDGEVVNYVGAGKVLKVERLSC